MKYFGLVVFLTVLAFGGCTLWHHSAERKVADKQVTTSCVSDADPCIEIMLQGGEKYKLNDFRFVPTNCIDFISLPDRKNHSYCGLYELHWIGPEPVKGETV